MEATPLPGDRVLIPLGHRTLPAVVQYVSDLSSGVWVTVEIEMDGPDSTARNMYPIDEVQPIIAA